MGVYGIGRERRQVQLPHLLAYISRDALTGRRHGRNDTVGFVKPSPISLTEPFRLGDRTDRVALALEVTCHELAVTTDAALPGDQVVGVAKGAEALGDWQAGRWGCRGALVPGEASLLPA